MVDRPQGVVVPIDGVAATKAVAVSRVTLTDFRSYGALRLDVAPGPVVLTGPNGAGKTNLLEALSFLVPGRGLRHARLTDVGRRAPNGAEPRPWAVAARVETATGVVEIGTGYQPGSAGGRDKRVVRIDGETVSTQAALADHVGAIWLTPQMDRLFQDGPAARRRFLDRMVFDSDPAHLGRVNAFEHAMRERAKLLRAPNADSAWLATLEETMAEKGIAVAAARIDLIRRLSARLADGTGVFPGAAVEAEGAVESWLANGPALAAEDRFRHVLAAERRRDADDGRTRTGPHRSDVRVRHLGNGRSAEQCSTGEQKALLVALVLTTTRLRAQERAAAPLLLLDEIAAHLDEQRLDALFDALMDIGAQAWLTGTDAGLFKSLEGRAGFYRVADGSITAA